jgi:hypothetical protein
VLRRCLTLAAFLFLRKAYAIENNEFSPAVGRIVTKLGQSTDPSPRVANSKAEKTAALWELCEAACNLHALDVANSAVELLKRPVSLVRR